MSRTSIEWSEVVWNPTVGCSKLSPGCKSCYALREARRLAYNPNPKIAKVYCDVVTPKGTPLNWTGKLKLVPERLEIPLHWRKARLVFVNSMSDLFHEALPDEAIDQVFAVMALCPHLTFQVLTKRAERMHSFMNTVDRHECVGDEATEVAGGREVMFNWPLRSVRLGVSIEDQATADERIPWLLKTPAAVRFISLEPMLGPVNIAPYLEDASACLEPHEGAAPLDQVIVGGESGPGARPCDVAGIRSVIEQCRAAGVPCFVKQLGAKPRIGEKDHLWAMANITSYVERSTGDIILEPDDPKGADMSEWPKDLRVQEQPS